MKFYSFQSKVVQEEYPQKETNWIGEKNNLSHWRKKYNGD